MRIVHLDLEKYLKDVHRKAESIRKAKTKAVASNLLLSYLRECLEEGEI